MLQYELNNIVVIGSGVMGSRIAAQIANSGHKVYLLDIVPEMSMDRNILSRQAIGKLGGVLSSPKKADNIIIGNLEDDIEVIKQANWIIEAIIENFEIKQQLYKKLEQYCLSSCIISSNTSTISLSKLTEKSSNNFKQHFLISHFFNPPRQMQLLELVTQADLLVIKPVLDFIDIHMGKTIIRSNDTPGFIANRIGCYWLAIALELAMKMDVSIEEVDSIMSSPLGIPKTGVFGLYDLIGIDVMQLIFKSLYANLKPQDEFFQIHSNILEEMVKSNMLGHKTNGGFYRNLDNGEREVLDLRIRKYHLCKPIISPINGILEIFKSNDYARTVLCKTLNYAASLIPEVSDSVYDIDKAMKLGFNWKFGPFEMLDLIGPGYFKNHLRNPAKILEVLGNRRFYQQDSYFNGKDYSKITKSIIQLSDYKIKAPIMQNSSCSIWDIGNDIINIEITNKMGILNHQVFELILKSCNSHSKIIIANEQSNFSVGGDLKFMLKEADNIVVLKEYLELGQAAMLALKNSSVVSALKGKALGGGGELLLHSSKVIAHDLSNAGLIETRVGLIPAWGGCTELILRSKTADDLIKAFKNIALAKVASSADELEGIINSKEIDIVMNQNRVFEKATQVKQFIKVEKLKRKLIEVDWQEVISQMKLDSYQSFIAKELSYIFSQNHLSEKELMKLEIEIFIELISRKETREKIRAII